MPQVMGVPATIARSEGIVVDDRKVSLAVLVSGRGSNLEALLKKERAGYFERAHIACVISNVPDVRALDIAREYGIPGLTVRSKTFSSPDAYEEELALLCSELKADFIALAGYMKIVGPVLLGHYPHRILNIHPSLLPSFPGLHGQRQALEHGVRISGCTVHFIDAGVDTGPIVGQRSVPVLQDDTEDTLSRRILEQEHELYAECVKKITEQPWEIRGRRIYFPNESKR